MIKIGIHGSMGRMGQEITALIPSFKDCILVYSYSRGSGNLEELCAKSDVILDFSSLDALDRLLDIAYKSNTAILIGTTGLSSEIESKIFNLSKKISILQTPNTSFGIALLNKLVAQAAQALPSYETDISDTHHANKKDAPSGTALMLGKAIAKAQGKEFYIHNHLSGTRKPGEIGFSAIRAGNSPGEHEIIFTGLSEVITLTHKTSDRSVFAEGAIRVAIWLAGRRKGLYNMADVL